MIYFVTTRELCRVKIGYSADPRSRFVKLQSDSPVKLLLECICPGEMGDEAALHIRFAKHRVQGEWFTLASAIEDHMASLPTHKPAVREPSMNKRLTDLGVSKSYASMILSGKLTPARPLAIHILRTTGWRHPVIAELSDDELAVFERVQPWVLTATRPQQSVA